MFNKKDLKVVLTGRIEFIQDENESPKNNFTLDSNKFEYNKDAINKILRDAGFQLSKCFQSLIDLNFGDSGKQHTLDSDLFIFKLIRTLFQSQHQTFNGMEIG